MLHGQLPDVDIQQTVEAFGKTHSPLRLLIASDVASEGLNLHYQAHRLIHFDIPWSLMVFQQRNGRIDRYGQSNVPQIGYLLTLPDHERIRGDLRILEILIEKDGQAAKNIGDPSAFMGLYDEDLETARVADAIECNTTAEAFAAQLANGDVDPFELLWNAAQTDSVSKTESVFAAKASPLSPVDSLPVAAQDAVPTAQHPSLFADDYCYTRDALNWLRQLSPREQPSVQFDDAKRTLSFQPSADLARLLDRELAAEMRPRDNEFALSADKSVIDAAIKNARDGEDWPQVHYLWPLHPIAQWLDYKLLALFGRQRAPAVRVRQGVAEGESIVLVLAQVPNRRGQTMLTECLGVRVAANGEPQTVLALADVLALTALGEGLLANDGRIIETNHIQAALPAVIERVGTHLKPIKQAFDADCKQRLALELDKLKALKAKHGEQLEIEFAKGIEQIVAVRKRKKEEATTDLFGQYQDWIRQTLELDDRPQYTIVAVLTA